MSNQRRPFVLLVLILAIPALASCTKAGPTEPAGVATADKENALQDATTVCNGLLPLGEDGMANFITSARESANLAAEAALNDPRWDGLATAASDMSVVYDKVGGTEGTGADALPRLRELLPEVEAAKGALLAECRRVLAAGGAVDEARMDGFIEPESDGSDWYFADDDLTEMEIAYSERQQRDYLDTAHEFDHEDELDSWSDNTVVRLGASFCESYEYGVPEDELMTALSEEKSLEMDTAVAIVTGALMELCE
ncbi:hypothetical protein [Nocardioides gilvus]|uniref:hypothetical protein n=1 Tax=Nocardioides gilvus TaxID=1735589 RepID=UPI0013A55ED5|nr:hypothetical protein [Nocardioides gilvus]